MSAIPAPRGVWRKHIALPQQHGSWALWLGPFAIGALIGGLARPGMLWLALASLGAFLALQPATILIKALSGRRGRGDAPAAAAWLSAYAALAALGAAGLALSGNAALIALGLVALPALAWQLWLVAHTAERHNLWAEVAGAAALALCAPAAYWVDGGGTLATGSTLWALCALQSGAAVAYIYVRLAYRRMTQAPTWAERARLAALSTAWHSANLIVAALLALAGLAPALVVVPFAAMLAEAVYGGLLRPGIGVRPTIIGVRQVLLTALFAALMVAAYRLT